MSDGILGHILTAIAALGGLLGAAGGVAVLAQRRKLRADAADVITDTALTLVQPLRERVTELEERTRSATRQVDELSASVATLAGTLRSWRLAVLSPHVTRDELRAMVSQPIEVPPRRVDIS
ncbi:putative coiled-coil protein SlyX [Catenuloplanes nepalensis]|uniref:Coiled-coil protein SlyX n=1 Tax=Catenuloplanes nepalensis TaxID=587533 RepID=A0ABT9N6K9_9ACTN|nr:hypothetical protein [Catenuloplanes nepalensis]MDP9799337.1 putative coiled-coil protein SlyX [Catenuloplanes nepalensis]